MAEQQAPPLTIQEFLEARWSEREKVAQSAVGDVASASIDNYGHLTVPAFEVLAELAAKRAILKQWVEAEQAKVDICATFAGDMSVTAKVDRARFREAAHALHEVVRSLASVHRDHPDWRADW